MRDKTILVTGGSKGLGLEIIKTLLSENYKVVNISRTNPKYSGLNSENLLNINFDLSDPSEIKELYLNTLKLHGPFYGLVNNAGVAYDDLVTNLNYEPLLKMFNVNVFSSMFLTKYIIRDMILSKTKGSIVHISSVSGHTGYKGLSMYASSKIALEGFSKNVAREWGRLGIRSNCICPGFLETEMSSTLSVETKAKIYSRTCLGVETYTSSVAGTVKFLLSDEAKSITGQVLHVDSGTI